jgi:hypothetical protein
MFRSDLFASDIDEREFFGDHWPAPLAEATTCDYCAQPPVTERHGEALCRDCAKACQDCEQSWTVRVPQPVGDDLFLCSSCESARGEDADERFLSDFHGGSAPQASYDATYARKR